MMDKMKELLKLLDDIEEQCNAGRDFIDNILGNVSTMYDIIREILNESPKDDKTRQLLNDLICYAIANNEDIRETMENVISR